MNDLRGRSSCWRRILLAPCGAAATLRDHRGYLKNFRASPRAIRFLPIALKGVAASVLRTGIAARSASHLWTYRSVIALSLIALPHAALAYDWEVVAHLTEVEGSYVPNEVTIMIDQTAGACAARAWLTYSGNPSANNLTANVQAVYAGLLAALQTGSRIDIYGSNAGCTTEYVHFLSN